jgi:hypothetical protein
MAERPDSQTGEGSLGDFGKTEVHPPSRTRSHHNRAESNHRHLNDESHVDPITAETSVDYLLDHHRDDDASGRRHQGNGKSPG